MLERPPFGWTPARFNGWADAGLARVLRRSDAAVAVRRAAVVVAILVAAVVLRDPARERCGVGGGRRRRRWRRRRGRRRCCLGGGRRWRGCGSGRRGRRRRRHGRGDGGGGGALAAQPVGLDPRCLLAGTTLRRPTLRSAGRATLRGPRMMHDRGDGRGRVSRRRARGPASCEQDPEQDGDDQPTGQRAGLIKAVKRTYEHRLSPRTPRSIETFPGCSRKGCAPTGVTRSTSAR